MYRFAGSPVVFGKGNVSHPPSSFPPVFPSHPFSTMSSSGGVRIGGVGVGCRVANRYRRSTVIVSTLNTYQVRSSGGASVIYCMPFMLLFIRPPGRYGKSGTAFRCLPSGCHRFPPKSGLCRSHVLPDFSEARARQMRLELVPIDVRHSLAGCHGESSRSARS